MSPQTTRMTGLRAETSATSAVVTLSVAVAVIGHVLAGGGQVPFAVVPQLIALAAVCWLLGAYLAGRRWLSVAVLAGVQLAVHLTLDSTHREPPVVMPAGHHHHAHDMPMPAELPGQAMHEGFTGAVTMAAAHLLVILAGVVLLDRTHQWAARVLRILARLVPELPAGLIAVPAVGRPLNGVPELPRVVRRWSSSNVSRRGPPGVRVLPASS